MSRKKEIIFTVVIPFVVLVYRAHGMEIGVYGKILNGTTNTNKLIVNIVYT